MAPTLKDDVAFVLAVGTSVVTVSSLVAIFTMPLLNAWCDLARGISKVLNGINSDDDSKPKMEGNDPNPNADSTTAAGPTAVPAAAAPEPIPKEKKNKTKNKTESGASDSKQLAPSA